VVTAFAAVVAIVVAGLLMPRSGKPMITDRLSSGLPIGHLRGSVYITAEHRGNRADGLATFNLTVLPDGSGTFTPPRSMAGGGGDTGWPVRFVGSSRGHVVMMREDVFCGRIADLTLDFVVQGRTVVITRAVADKCTVWPRVAEADLTTATLVLADELQP